MKTDLEKWMQFNLGSTGALTGTDWKALRAAVAILELYAYDGSASVLPAFRAVVLRMQATTREYAYHAIAMVLDWRNRTSLWAKADLTPIAKPMRCKAEPGPAMAMESPSYGSTRHGEREWNFRGDQLTDKGMIEFMP